MRIAFLLESTCLCGGVKVVLRQAEALGKRGYHVTVISNDSYPDWFEGAVGYQRGDPFDRAAAQGFDRIICTTPRLVAAQYDPGQNRGFLWQLIQGYEGEIPECRNMVPEIQDAYSLPVPAMTVSQRLADYLRGLFPERNFYSVGQGIETNHFYPPADLPLSNEVRNLILVGPLTISLKQIRTGLKAYVLARKKHSGLRLIRITSVDTRAEEEEITGKIAEYHVHVSPARVGDIFRNSRGMLLFPSGPEEGFGLPPLEAMACGLPTVLTRIPSLVEISSPADFAVFVNHDSAGSMAEGICELIEKSSLRKYLVSRGAEVVSGFSYEDVAEKMESAFKYAGQ